MDNLLFHGHPSFSFMDTLLFHSGAGLQAHGHPSFSFMDTLLFFIQALVYKLMDTLRSLGDTIQEPQQ